MKVFSNPRTGPEDQSGTNVRLFNETDKPFYVYLINEDLYCPPALILWKSVIMCLFNKKKEGGNKVRTGFKKNRFYISRINYCYSDTCRCNSPPF